MKRLILLAVVLSVGMSLAGWRGRFDEQFAAATASWTPAALNPIAWYKGDGDATDAMGNYDGTWAGTEAYADGATGQAFDFDVGNGLNIGNVSPDGSDGYFTISTWVLVRPFSSDSGNNARGSVVSKWRSAASGQMEYHVAVLKDNSVLFRYSNTELTAREVRYGTVPFDTWVHIVCVAGEYQSVYINGVLADSIYRGDSGVARNSNSARLGAFNFTWASYEHRLDGKLDDVLIFDRALTAEEIEKLYNESINKDGAAW